MSRSSFWMGFLCPQNEMVLQLAVSAAPERNQEPVWTFYLGNNYFPTLGKGTAYSKVPPSKLKSWALVGQGLRV